MYNVNLLPRRVLITPAEVINNIPTDEVLGIKKVLYAIEIAEERFVRPALGYDFYEALATQKNTTVTSGNIADLQAKLDAQRAADAVRQPYILTVGQMLNATEFLTTAAYLTLWNERLVKFIAECVRFVALPENYAQFTNQGIMKNNPAIAVISDKQNDSASIGLADVKFLMDKWIQDRIEPLQTSLHLFLCKNAANYPLYGNKCDCDKQGDAIATKKSGFIIPSVYEEIDERRERYDRRERW